MRFLTALLSLFFSFGLYSQTYEVEEKPSYTPNTRTYKVTKQGDGAYENPKEIEYNLQFPVFDVSKFDFSGFRDARLNEWQNMRARRYQKYRFNPNKKNTLKLYRANKVIGLPFDAGIRPIDFNEYVVPKF